VTRNIAIEWVGTEESPNWRDGLVWMDTLNSSGYSPKPVTSVAAMVTAAQYDTIGNGRMLDFIAIWGHGTGGFQGLGCGKKYEDTGVRSLRYQSMVLHGQPHLLGTATQNIKALNGVLSNQAEVLLGGCSVGDGLLGTGLLTTISSLLRNRPVHAFENEVYWWTRQLAGKVKTARGNSVTSTWTWLPLRSSDPLCV
jgi:hypothetical protein